MRLFNSTALILTVLIGMQVSAHSTTASYYADKFNGRKTASGEIFSNDGMTCASNRYELGTYVEVTNVKTGESITCKVVKSFSNISVVTFSIVLFSVCMFLIFDINDITLIFLRVSI